jgi:CDP-6-deoxy-D-xylo-4-hexulose-3-dehydrase
MSMTDIKTEKELRRQIQELVAAYSTVAHSPQKFVPGKTPIPPSGKVFAAEELVNLVDASLDFWLTTGRFNQQFEKKLGAFLTTKHTLTVNSGSSANLLAIAALASPRLGERALKPGDEVISVAAGFPTTVNPLLLYGLVPVFLDVHIPTYNIDPALIESAITEKTRAIALAHTLGNPFAVREVMRIARKHHLWVVEDCCDALGSEYEGARVGTFGHIGTLSFYPAHHITMGEGGAVFTNDDELATILESIRDWGRDCYCAPGKDNTCGKRFAWQLGDLPFGYDHKYTYSELGYNMKITDMQAAVALAQMDRLPGFIQARRKNFGFLKQRLSGLQEMLILPEATEGANPSWFGFPITLTKGAGPRLDLLRFLDQHRIGTRQLFGGNLTRQPYLVDRREQFRIASPLSATDTIMNNTFWLGVYPGLTEEMLDYAASQIETFFQKNP